MKQVGIQRVLARANIGASNNLLSIISQDEISQHITLIFCNANPGAGLLTAGGGETMVSLIKDRFPPVELEKGRDISLDSGCFFNGALATQRVRGHVIEKKDHKKETKEPAFGWSTSSIHNSITKPFDVPNLPFCKVLMLVMGFTLEILDFVETKDVKDPLFTDLDLGIVREEAVWSTMLADEVLKSVGHLRFRSHPIGHSLGTPLPSIDLGHSAPGMSQDSIIVSWSV